MFKIKDKAKQFKRNLGKELTFENAKAYIESKGYQVVLFDDSTVEILIHGLTETAEKRDAFTFSEEINIVFIRKSLAEQVKLHLLIHEIGHILLGHMESDDLTSQTKDNEAEMFVRYVFGMTFLNGVNFKKIAFVVLVIVLTCYIIRDTIIQERNNALSAVNTSNTVSTANTLNTVNNQEMLTDTDIVEEEKVYYVTHTGKKYHTKDCMYAQNAIPVNEEYAKEYYQPCKICQP